MVYAEQGYLTDSVLFHLPVLAVVSISGSWPGKRALRYVPQHLFRKLVLVLVLLVGSTRLCGWWCHNLPAHW